MNRTSFSTPTEGSARDRGYPKQDTSQTMLPPIPVPAMIGLLTKGYCLLPGSDIQAQLARMGVTDRETAEFRDSFNDLAPDRHLADGGAYRLRKYATFDAGGRFELLRRNAPTPHYQAKTYNRVNGDVDRWFEETDEAFAAMRLTRMVLEGFRGVCEGLSMQRRWRCELHQFRVVATGAEPGLPTPEGLHRDGVDFGFVMLVARQNVAGGRTTLQTRDGEPLAEFTLAEPFTILLMQDEMIHHGVSSIIPIDPAKDAFRDTLVVTMRGLD